jgi:hypothetical protein
MWCTIQDISILNNVNVVTTMIIGVNIIANDTCNKLCIHISKASVEKNAPPPTLLPNPHFAQTFIGKKIL